MKRLLYLKTIAKNMLESIIENNPETSFLKADGFDDCVIGVCYECDKPKLVYSVSKVIKKLCDDGMQLDEALEYYDYNIANAYVGEQTPIWCYDLFT